ncbi:cytochrome b [Fulvimonas soli]|jgi:cytochrome b561|uniref:Cytochrome b561 n=1 Tax=Fulvimonas soli TaxID=155197 RepID=A0A316IGA4_9GAMM|nr:cytochrome b/b6 domain-containing protein [Fulvimonas soli]PWK92351.1 cytochrome b561 [Fulvimonas soli]TNY25944.1 cytochrome B [Fulvimonas soli]
MSLPARYDRLAVVLHWLSVLLVALAYLSIELRGPRGSDSRAFWTNVHLWSGSLLLALSMPRLLWRWWRGAPPPVPAGPLSDGLRRAVHAALYGFVLLQPLLGMLALNLGGRPVVLAGWSFSLAGPMPALGKAFEESHELLGNLFYAVIGVHAAAALWHHCVRRDGLLSRMSLR